MAVEKFYVALVDWKLCIEAHSYDYSFINELWNILIDLLYLIGVPSEHRIEIHNYICLIENS